MVIVRQDVLPRRSEQCMRPNDFLYYTFESGCSSSINDTNDLRKLLFAPTLDLVYDRAWSFSFLPHEGLAIRRKLNDHVLDLTVWEVDLLAEDTSVKPVSAHLDVGVWCNLVFSPEHLNLRFFLLYPELFLWDRIWINQLGIHIITGVTVTAVQFLRAFLRDKVTCLQRPILFCLFVVVHIVMRNIHLLLLGSKWNFIRGLLKDEQLLPRLIGSIVDV